MCTKANLEASDGGAVIGRALGVWFRSGALSVVLLFVLSSM